MDTGLEIPRDYNDEKEEKDTFVKKVKSVKLNTE